VQSIQRKSQRAEQRLDGQEANRCRHLPEVVRAKDIVLVLDGHPHPYVRRPWKTLGKPGKTLRPFREELIGVARCIGHHTEHTTDEILRYRIVKKVTHRVHKHRPVSRPSMGRLDEILVEGDSETRP